MNIAILPPDINESDKEFVAAASGIRFAMTAIKGVGEGVVEMILQERKKAGHFISLFQFFQRMDVKKIGKKVIEYLIEAGCFDFTGWSRQSMVESVDPMFSVVSRQQEETAKGVMHLFGFVEEENRFTVPPPLKTSTPRDVILRREKELLGFYLTGHPMDAYRTLMQRLSCVPLAEIGRLPNDSVYRIAGIIETVQIKISAKSQRKFAILSVGDGFERIEIPVWSDLYEEKTALLVENQLIYAVLHSENREGNQRLNVKWIDDLTRADEAMISTCDTLCEKVKGQVKKAEHSEKYRQNSSKDKSMEKKTQEVKAVLSKLVVKLDVNLMRHSHILDLKNIFYSFHGSTPIYLQFYDTEVKSIATIEITSLYGVSYSQELEKALQSLTFIKEICLEELKK
jgi:DNA polymerase-3 subunit alpha